MLVGNYGCVVEYMMGQSSHLFRHAAQTLD